MPYRKLFFFYLLALFFVRWIEASDPLMLDQINPPNRPHIQKNNSIFLRGDYLYWIAQQDDMHFGALVCLQPNNNRIIRFNLNGSVNQFDYTYDPGFRLLAGYNIPYDGWDLSAYWTHFRSSAAGCSAANPPFESFQINQNPNGVQSSCDSSRLVFSFAPLSFNDQTLLGTQVNAHWDLKFDDIAVSLGREYFVSPKLTLSPYIGPRGVIIDQELLLNHIWTFKTVNGDVAILDRASASTRFNNDFYGIGPQFGLHSNWYLYKGLHIYADLALSLFYGEFELLANPCYEREISQDCTFFTTLDRAHSPLKDCFHTTKAATDIQLGLAWEQTMANDQLNFKVLVGWDHHLFFEQNQLIRFEDEVVRTSNGAALVTQLKVKERRHGDLSLQGLTVGAQIEF